VILLFGHVISLFGHVILLFGHVISSLIPMLAGNVPREMTLVVKPFLAFLARIWTFSGVYQ
jgi:Mg/Co/Ni transporter MgtE